MAGLFDLSGKVALVTGSTRGIGRAIAEAMQAAGASVVISNENADETAAVAAALAGPDEAPALAVERRQHVVLELPAHALVIGQHRSHHVPEARAVVHLAQVRELVGHDVVDGRQREVHQPPVQAHRAVGAGAAPAGGRRAERQPLHAHAQFRREVRAALLEHAPGLALLAKNGQANWALQTTPQPGLNGRRGYQPRGRALVDILRARLMQLQGAELRLAPAELQKKQVHVFLGARHAKKALAHGGMARIGRERELDGRGFARRNRARRQHRDVEPLRDYRALGRQAWLVLR